MHQKMEREENFPGSKALGLSCFPSEGGMRKLWLSRKAVGKNQRSLSWPLQLTKLWAEGSPDVCPVHAVLCFLQDLFLSGLRLRAHLVLLFILEGRGVSASSTLPTSRLLNYYFVGSRDRSQLTRPAPPVKVGLKSPWVG